jgi:gluconate 2-dehydrogenase gamma chain
MDRRDVLRGMASGAAAPIVAALLPAEWLSWGRDVHAAVGTGQPAAGTLAATTMQTLAVTCERIIPADDTPGATAAGVPAFIERMLSDWYDPPDRGRVVAGLESLEALARSRHGRAFAACAEAEQNALLLELDREGPTHWFGTVKYLTIWGYYTSEIGVVRELGQWPSPGRYDGCAPYAPRPRQAQVQR